MCGRNLRPTTGGPSTVGHMPSSRRVRGDASGDAAAAPSARRSRPSGAPGCALTQRRQQSRARRARGWTTSNSKGPAVQVASRLAAQRGSSRTVIREATYVVCAARGTLDHRSLSTTSRPPLLFLLFRPAGGAGRERPFACPDQHVDIARSRRWTLSRSRSMVGRASAAASAARRQPQSSVVRTRSACSSAFQLSLVLSVSTWLPSAVAAV